MQTMLTLMRDPAARKRAAETVTLFGTSVVITSGFAHYMYSVRICKGPSMLPTLPTSRELVVVDKLSYGIQGKDYKHGDVVVSISMRDPHISETSLSMLTIHTYRHFSHLLFHSGM